MPPQANVATCIVAAPAATIGFVLPLSMFISIFALAEGALGLLALDVVPKNTGGIVGAVFLGAAGITGLIGWNLRRQTEPLSPPPPRQEIGFS